LSVEAAESDATRGTGVRPSRDERHHRPPLV